MNAYREGSKKAELFDLWSKEGDDVYWGRGRKLVAAGKLTEATLRSWLYIFRREAGAAKKAKPKAKAKAPPKKAPKAPAKKKAAPAKAPAVEVAPQ